MSKEDLRGKIISSAFRLFAAKGYNGVSISDIIQESKVSKGALYHYFPSKQDLFESVLETYFLSFLENGVEFIQGLSGTLAQKLESVEAYYIATLEQMHSMTPGEKFSNYYLLMFDGMERLPSIREKVKRSYQRLADELTMVVKQGQAAGEANPSFQAEAIAFQLLAATEGIVLFETLGILGDERSGFAAARIRELFLTIQEVIQNEKK